MRASDVLLHFDYTYWATYRILDAAARVSLADFTASATATVRGLRETLVHELDVQWSWRLRLQGAPIELWGPDAELKPEDFPTVEVLTERWRADETELRAYLATLTDDDLARPVDIGSRHRFPLWYYLMHLVHHGAQQRADAATVLTAYGQSPGDLGFLEFAAEMGG